MEIKDITKDVKFGDIDGECLQFIKCKCGKEWDYLLSIYEDTSTQCPNCKRNLFFKNNITIYEIEGD